MFSHCFKYDASWIVVLWRLKQQRKGRKTSAKNLWTNCIFWQLLKNGDSQSSRLRNIWHSTYTYCLSFRFLFAKWYSVINFIDDFSVPGATGHKTSISSCFRERSSNHRFTEFNSVYRISNWVYWFFTGKIGYTEFKIGYAELNSITEYLDELCHRFLGQGEDPTSTLGKIL